MRNIKAHNMAMLLWAAFLCWIMSHNPAYAVNTPMGNTLCTVAGWMSGNTGIALETMAILFIGIGALLGKITWSLALIHGIGVAIIFGAAQIVNSLGAGGPMSCATS